jgi:hypothetical protein
VCAPLGPPTRPHASPVQPPVAGAWPGLAAPCAINHNRRRPSAVTAWRCACVV